jgi:hypothetical protein
VIGVIDDGGTGFLFKNLSRGDSQDMGFGSCILCEYPRLGIR